MPGRSAAGYVNHWTSAVGALAGLLASLGSALSIDEVAVLSGHAFRFAITAGPDGAFGVDGPSCFSSRSAFPLYERLGLRFHAFEAPAGASDFEARKREALDAVRRSVRKGKPAIAYALPTAEFGLVLVAGEATLLVSSTMSGQFSGRLPLSQWPPPGRNLPLRVFVTDKETRFRRGDALAAALAFAVHYAEAGEEEPVPGCHRLASGLPAFRRWSELLESTGQVEAVSATGHALCIQALSEARGEAVRVLAHQAAAESEPRRGLLAGAASAYAAEGLLLSRLASLFPYPNGGDVRSAGVRRVAAAIVTDVGRAESSAVQRLRDYLTA